MSEFNGTTPTGSLLEAPEAEAPRPRRRLRLAGLLGWTRVFRMTPGELVSTTGGWIGRRRRVAAGALAVLLAGAGFWAWRSTRVIPPPDYTSARLDLLFEYTLLTDDFNRLPVEQRIELLGQLVRRLRAMGGDDSLLLALFATMIMGEARAQLEENLSRLAIDVADKFAVDYDPNASEEDRTAYLEDAFVEMQEMFAFLGERPEKTPEQMLADGRRQARRDLQRFRDGRVGAGEVIRVFDLMNNGIGRNMSGHQKVRVQTMFRDMTEMLRRGP
jgi:hypothetical protein